MSSLTLDPAGRTVIAVGREHLTGQHPAVLFPLPPGEWAVNRRSLQPDAEARAKADGDDGGAWSYVKTGEKLRVPLLGYVTAAAPMAAVLATAEVVARLVDASRNRLADALLVAEPEVLPDGRARLWIGYAYRVR
jgi:hypothetical protein